MSRGGRRSSQAVTIQTVAERAGVSMMTVSNVLNNRRNVREQTREAVLEAVRELGYKPNLAARSLASAAAVRIGLLCGMGESGFLSSVLVGAVDESSERGAQLIIRRYTGHDVDAMLELVDELAQLGAGAMIAPPPFCEALSRRDLPIPMVGICSGDELSSTPTVRIDDRAAAKAMTAYLVSLGHRRIGFIRMDPALHAGRTRYEGYCEALAEAGIAIDQSIVAQGSYTFDSGLVAAQQLLSLPQRPTAIFAGNDDMAAAVVSLAHRMGMDIPGELSVAGFDDGPVAVKIWPRLTTIRQPVSAMSAEAMRHAVEIAQGAREADQEATYFDFELVIRDSTAPPKA
ncbi:LacI family DNA-binding transcriptional regulator [Novosphingobium flavum]|uniref:LacI family DNA-binding transcriptional regulator n=1 Tax=Novosphingobium flavum TaxID=1778672 RepID=A0A7X1FR46_9SPHN|nr:LacI family DNA-binding transcriptional regulator [Novosphingobium flavum]MBC2665408.1 LacI family DNA-binding transcriptional regulator [Novosphingobium flavum]